MLIYILQGLYPEKTGIVANKFYDEEYGSFSGRNLVEGKWFGGEPVSKILFTIKFKTHLFLCSMNRLFHMFNVLIFIFRFG